MAAADFGAREIGWPPKKGGEAWKPLRASRLDPGEKR
jgi:hypothetical protein